MLAIPLGAGYLIALPVLGWGLDDLKRFHRHEWFGYGHAAPWHAALLVSYAVAGWPVLLVAFVWRTSLTRRALMEQRSDHHRSPNGA